MFAFLNLFKAIMIPFLLGCIFWSKDEIGEIVGFFVLSFFAANSFTTIFLVPWYLTLLGIIYFESEKFIYLIILFI